MQSKKVKLWLENPTSVDALTWEGYSETAMKEYLSDAAEKIDIDFLYDALWYYHEKRDRVLLESLGVRIAESMLESIKESKTRVNELERFLEDGEVPRETVTSKYTDHS